ncbi:hypothetical protein [Spartinivicinus ruber]|uniref:hypothetical protein n=1 Tax=Spartinivicinus ruber TaxID=2683272 RepID=UPI0013D03B00|nr:hypothetical protein [Spartinivicinus ruber]
MDYLLTNKSSKILYACSIPMAFIFAYWTQKDFAPSGHGQPGYYDGVIYLLLICPIGFIQGFIFTPFIVIGLNKNASPRSKAIIYAPTIVTLISFFYLFFRASL